MNIGDPPWADGPYYPEQDIEYQIEEAERAYDEACEVERAAADAWKTWVVRRIAFVPEISTLVDTFSYRQAAARALAEAKERAGE